MNICLPSVDKRARKEALDALRLYLQRTATFNELELLKLWKGFFYCMWMTANPLPQHRLAEDFSTLVTQTLAGPNVLPFIDAFWQTMAREWTNIDSLRLDKYLRLCRLMLYSSFDYLKASGFNEEQVKLHNELLTRTPLNPEDMKIPNGLRHHVLDIFVDGLAHLHEDAAEMQPSGSVIRLLLDPVTHVLEHTRVKSVRKQARETLADSRLSEWGLEMQTNQNPVHDAKASTGAADFDGFD